METEPLLIETALTDEHYKSSNFLGLHFKYKKTQLLKFTITIVSALSTLACFSFFIGFLFALPSRILNKPVNVIMMISDGFGPASQTFARNYYQYSNKLDVGYMLPLDTILVGSSRTRSYSSLVTDSAAGATAFSCGIKSYNAAIGVGPDRKPCGTVLEAAKEKGMLTGLVVTSRITHATPAAFASHVVHRDLEADIASHEIGNYTLGRSVDLMFGGGKCFFLPITNPNSCRNDDIDHLKLASDLGWNVQNGIKDFQNMNKTNLPLLNLFAMDHMDFEIDRDPKVQPSLKEMSIKALELLSMNSKNGFFLMIEGSRIDMAAHSNDPVAHLHDILMYNDVVQAVKKYIDENPDTVMISVSDHETGGFSVSHQLGSEYPIYDWYPEHLVNVKHSGEFIAKNLLAISLAKRKKFVLDVVFKEWLSVKEPKEEDVLYLSSAIRTSQEIEYYCGELSQLGWSTHGHSAVDVNLYSYGAKSDELRGNHENTDISDFIQKHLGLKQRMQSITERLNRK